MKNYIIFLIVYTAISKYSCTNIKSELQITNGSNITTEQKNAQNSSLINRMRESIDSEYPQVIIYIPNNEDPLEGKQSPLKHIRNLLLSFFDRLIKKEIDFDDDYSIFNEVKRLNKEVIPQNDTDEGTSSIWKDDVEVFSSNFDNNPLDENDVVEEAQNLKCLSCQNTKLNDNNHSCKRMTTANAEENKLENSSKMPSDLTKIISTILPGFIINAKNLTETPETNILVKREVVLPTGTSTSSKELSTSKPPTNKKIMQSTEQFLTEFIDKNTKYFVGETNDLIEDSTTNKFEKVNGNKRIRKKNKYSVEKRKLAAKSEHKDLIVEPKKKAVNKSLKSNSTNKFLDTHHFLLNSGGTANQSATASIVKNKIDLKFNIHKILSNVETKSDLSFSRSKRNSNKKKIDVESSNKLLKIDEDRYDNIKFMKGTTNKSNLQKRSDPETESTSSESEGTSESLEGISDSSKEENESTAESESSNTTDEDEEIEQDLSKNTKGLSEKPLLMIITVPTFFGIGILILLLCFVTRNGGWCCKLFNIQYYKDPQTSNL